MLIVVFMGFSIWSDIGAENNIYDVEFSLFLTWIENDGSLQRTPTLVEIVKVL